MARKSIAQSTNPFGGVSSGGTWDDPKNDNAKPSTGSYNPFGPSASSSSAASSSSTNPFGGPSSNAGNRPFGSSPQMQQRTFHWDLVRSVATHVVFYYCLGEAVKVDTEATREALRLAQESLMLGTSTLEALSVQAGTSFFFLFHLVCGNQ